MRAAVTAGVLLLLAVSCQAASTVSKSSQITICPSSIASNSCFWPDVLSPLFYRLFFCFLKLNAVHRGWFWSLRSCGPTAVTWTCHACCRIDCKCSCLWSVCSAHLRFCDGRDELHSAVVFESASIVILWTALSPTPWYGLVRHRRMDRMVMMSRLAHQVKDDERLEMEAPVTESLCILQHWAASSQTSYRSTWRTWWKDSRWHPTQCASNKRQAPSAYQSLMPPGMACHLSLICVPHFSTCDTCMSRARTVLAMSFQVKFAAYCLNLAHTVVHRCLCQQGVWSAVINVVPYHIFTLENVLRFVVSWTLLSVRDICLYPINWATAVDLMQ